MFIIQSPSTIGSIYCGDQTFNTWALLGPFIHRPSACPPIQGWWVLLVPKRVVQGGYPVYFWGSHQVWWLRGDDFLSSFWACIWLAALSCLPFLKTAPTEDILPPKSTTHFREAVYHDGVVDAGKIVPPGPPCHFWKVSLASEPSAQWAEAFAESKVQFLPSG